MATDMQGIPQVYVRPDMFTFPEVSGVGNDLTGWVQGNDDADAFLVFAKRLNVYKPYAGGFKNIGNAVISAVNATADLQYINSYCKGGRNNDTLFVAAYDGSVGTDPYEAYRSGAAFNNNNFGAFAFFLERRGLGITYKPASFVPPINYAANGRIKACAMSADGRFVAVVPDTATDLFRVYRRDGDVLRQIPIPIGTDIPISASFSEDGKYLAVANDFGPSFRIYRNTFGPQGYVLLFSSGLELNAYSIRMTRDGQYVSLYVNDASALRVFRMNYSATTTATAVLTLAGTFSPNTSCDPFIAWSDDGQIMVAMRNASPFLVVYRRHFSALVNIPIQTTGLPGTFTPVCVDISRTGRYIALGVNNNNARSTFLFEFIGGQYRQVPFYEESKDVASSTNSTSTMVAFL